MQIISLVCDSREQSKGKRMSSGDKSLGCDNRTEVTKLGVVGRVGTDYKREKGNDGGGVWYLGKWEIASYTKNININNSIVTFAQKQYSKNFKLKKPEAKEVKGLDNCHSVWCILTTRSGPDPLAGTLLNTFMH